MNIFLPNSFPHEDKISIGFCYLLNLCSDHIGNAFLKKVVELSKTSNIDFGTFVKAEFIANTYIDSNAISRPDILIETTTIELYLEIKVDSQPDFNQILRHCKTIPKKGYLILLSKIESQILSEAFEDSRYLRPSNRSHFKWVDFDSILTESDELNGTQKKIVNDFKQTLHTKELKGRSYNNLKGSIYEDESESQHSFLKHYAELMKEANWKASKFVNAYCIRANPVKFGQDILFNPRPDPSPTFIDKCYFYESMCSSVFIYKKTDIQKYRDRLAEYAENTSNRAVFYDYEGDYADCEDEAGKFYLIGWLITPLDFDLQNRLDEAWTLKTWSNLRSLLIK